LTPAKPNLLGEGEADVLTRRLVTTAGLCQIATLQGSSLAWSAEPVASALLAPASLFEFHSSFWLNLHLFLYNAARAQAGLDTRASAERALAETVGIATLSSDDQQTWRAAVADYVAGPARRDLLFDEGMVAVGNQLAPLDPASSPSLIGPDAGIAQALGRAAEIYRRLWWPRHDAQNLAWEASMRPLIADHGPAIATYETRAFEVSWPQQPIRVDVAAYANWAGGYTSERPSHTIIPSGDPGDQHDQGLEVLFHEALHTMDYPLFRALGAAFEANGKPLPRDPSHVFIFYTAGAATRQAVAGHVPYAELNGLWERVPDFKKALPLLEAHWQPHLDGQVSLNDAIAAYARAY
jgi:hypothetical protein